MSSLHPDHLLAEGSEPVKGTGSTLTTARGTSRKLVATKVTTVPTPRPGKVQSTGSAQTTTDGSAAAARNRRPAGAKAAAAAGTIAARAKAATSATSKAASAKAATAKVATARAAGAARAAAVAKGAAKAAAVAQVANRAAAARGAKASAAAQKPAAAAKPAAAKPVDASKAPAKAATPKQAAAKQATTKAAAPKPAVAATTAKAATAKAATPTEATAAKPAATPSAAKSGAVKAPAKPATKPAAKKPAATQPDAAKPAPTEAPTTAVRPTPYKRPVAADPAPAPVAVEPVAVEKNRVPVVDVVEASEVVTSLAEGRRRFLSRAPQTRRRPALYVAAALVGAMSVSGFTSGDPEAQAAANVSHSVSVAQELGIEAAPSAEITALDATRELAVLAASRSGREAEQAAAAHAQATADQAAAAAAAEAARPKAVLPVQGARLTSGFGPRWGSMHAGIDLAAPMHTPEYAAMDGVVLEAGPASGYGLAVYIQHANGDVTVYGHMDQILVAPGQVVKAGETIALLGNRGQSTGPHLHFEVHIGGIDGQKVDPIPYLRERGVQI
jgi:murein DD-endopeptidase MepM/ murein hydrolase activator NlpD